MAKTEFPSNRRPTHEEIARRAREIYEQSGRVPGRDVQNWLEAEAELKAGKPAAPRENFRQGAARHDSKPAGRGAPASGTYT